MFNDLIRELQQIERESARISVYADADEYFDRECPKTMNANSSSRLLSMTGAMVLKVLSSMRYTRVSGTILGQGAYQTGKAAGDTLLLQPSHLPRICIRNGFPYVP